MNIFEREQIDFANYNLIAGVDEAGRGPLAGPLVVAAVILKHNSFHEKLNDSKKLSEKQREVLYTWVIENSLAFIIKIISAKEIDEMNILQATLFGMKMCVDDLAIQPDMVLFDGNQIPRGVDIACKSVIKGDALYASIAAASILAKVTRDRIMIELDKKYPIYGFKTHKGYPTQKHRELIKVYGVTEEHRMSYSPCNSPSIYGGGRGEER